MSNKDGIIKYDSDEAATFKTHISGWVNRHGQFYGENEHLARWSGCTHLECSTEGCTTLVEVRGYTTCDKCREKNAEDKYFSLDVVEWNGSFPVYSHTFDEYFFDGDQLDDYLQDVYSEQGTVDNPRMVLCRPVLWRSLDTEYFTDDMYEDCEAPDELAKAVDELNKVIENLNKNKTSIAWEPDIYRVNFTMGCQGL